MRSTWDKCSPGLSLSGALGTGGPCPSVPTRTLRKELSAGVWVGVAGTRAGAKEQQEPGGCLQGLTVREQQVQGEHLPQGASALAAASTVHLSVQHQCLSGTVPKNKHLGSRSCDPAQRQEDRLKGTPGRHSSCRGGPGSQRGCPAAPASHRPLYTSSGTFHLPWPLAPLKLWGPAGLFHCRAQPLLLPTATHHGICAPGGVPLGALQDLPVPAYSQGWVLGTPPGVCPL